MNLFFDTTPIDAFYWLFPLGAGIAVFMLVEIEKFVIIRLWGNKVRRQYVPFVRDTAHASGTSNVFICALP